MNSLEKQSDIAPVSLKKLQQAAQDFRFLLNRGYPRKAALELVGNRYVLTADERHLLHRGVFSDADSESRRARRASITKIKNAELAIDGHNVLITIEAGISGRPLVLGDDGFMRDISGLSGNFRKTERTEKALQFIFGTLKKMKPRHVLFLLDAPISKSGELAESIRNLLIDENIPGDAQAVTVPEKILMRFSGVVATSDTAIIDHCDKVLDLAGHVLRKNLKVQSLIRLG